MGVMVMIKFNYGLQVVDYLLSVLEIDRAGICGLLGVSDKTLAEWMGVSENANEKSMRLFKLAKVVEYYLGREVSGADILNIIRTGEIRIDPIDDDITTLSLCHYINLFYDEVGWRAVADEAYDEYKNKYSANDCLEKTKGEGAEVYFGCSEETISKLSEQLFEKQEEIADMREELNGHERLIESMNEDAQLCEEEYIIKEQEAKAWEHAAEILMASIKDATEDGCTYNDNCPPNAKHYKCDACHFREATEQAKLVCKKYIGRRVGQNEL